jgi:hypothetical protein
MKPCWVVSLYVYVYYKIYVLSFGNVGEGAT